MRRLFLSLLIVTIFTPGARAAEPSAGEELPWSSVKTLYAAESEESRVLDLLRRAYAANPDHDMWRHPDLKALVDPNAAGERCHIGDLSYLWSQYYFEIELGVAGHTQCFRIHFDLFHETDVTIEHCP